VEKLGNFWRKMMKSKLIGLSLILGLMTAGRAIAAEPPVVTVSDIQGIDVSQLVADPVLIPVIVPFHSLGFTSKLNDQGDLFVHQFFVNVMYGKDRLIHFTQIDCAARRERNLITSLIGIGQGVDDAIIDDSPGEWIGFGVNDVASQSCAIAYRNRVMPVGE
jgi:hypothetical protein